MKRIVLILLAFVLIVVPAYSVPELWSGISFLGEVEQTSSAFMDRGYFEEYSSSNITRLGFRMRASIFPDYDVPLGVSAIADFLFPVGTTSTTRQILHLLLHTSHHFLQHGA